MLKIVLLDNNRIQAYGFGLLAKASSAEPLAQRQWKWLTAVSLVQIVV